MAAHMLILGAWLNVPFVAYARGISLLKYGSCLKARDGPRSLVGNFRMWAFKSHSQQSQSVASMVIVHWAPRIAPSRGAVQSCAHMIAGPALKLHLVLAPTMNGACCLTESIASFVDRFARITCRTR